MVFEPSELGPPLRTDGGVTTEHVLDMLAQHPVDSAPEKLIGTMREASRQGSKQNVLCSAGAIGASPEGGWG